MERSSSIKHGATNLYDSAYISNVEYIVNFGWRRNERGGDSCMHGNDAANCVSDDVLDLGVEVMR